MTTPEGHLYREAFCAVKDAHVCAPTTGYFISGDRHETGGFRVATACSNPACREITRLYVETSGYGPAVFHEELP